MLGLLPTAKDEMPTELIVNEILIDAMKVVGELFGSGKMQLPFVLQSAEVMKAALDYLQPFFKNRKEYDNNAYHWNGEKVTYMTWVKTLWILS